MATLNVTNITPPRVPLTDERTGLISREWYRFFLNLFVLTGSGTSQVSLADLQIGPPNATVEDLQNIKPDQFGIAPAQESNIDKIAELQKQIEAFQVAPLTTWILSQIAEIQKQIDALNSMPLPAQGTITAVTATAPVASSGGTAPDISLASGYGDTQNPYASKTANYVLAAPNGSAGVPTFRALVAADIPTLSYVTSVTGTAPVVSSGGATPAISMAAATTSVSGYLTSTDWNTFNNKGSGTVTAVSVVSANGFAGTSSGGATPALTLSTSITGLLKGNGTAISAATAGTDYLVPSAPVTYTANFSVATTDVWVINNKSGSSCTATLPTASSYTGRILRFQNYQAQTLISASSNVVPLVGGAAGTAILAAVAGETCILVSDGSNWIMTQYTPNNVLLLE